MKRDHAGTYQGVSTLGEKASFIPNEEMDFPD
jgi:hypothetical protein